MKDRVAELAATERRGRATAKGDRAHRRSKRTIDEAGYHYEHVDVAVDRKARHATITVSAPAAAQPADVAGIHAAGAGWWPLAMARELDDAILCCAPTSSRSAPGS